MTLNSAVEAQLPEFRALAESMMTDTFTVHIPTGGYTKVDGQEVLAYTTGSDTVGKVQGGSAATADPSTEYEAVGETRRPILRAGLHIPLSSAAPIAGDAGVGWEYECAAVGALSDVALLGKRYRVVNAPAKSNATARRLDVVEI